jgi:hypothetical protein
MTTRRRRPALHAGLALGAGLVALASSTARAEPKPAAATKATIGKTARAETATTKPAPATDSGNNTIGGHVGVAVPLVTVQGYTSGAHAAAPLEGTTTVSDEFILQIPIGVTVRTSRRLSVDFEVIVGTSVNPTGETALTVDPGVIYDWGPLATGLRLAVPIGATPMAMGLIPLVNRGIAQIGGATWFIEAAFPIMFHAGGAPTRVNTTGTNSRVEWSTVLHTGFGF